tara:strand:- start:168 stop:1106 length:939 start_codon:yes stop_codon:yes gene_type:complete
MSAIVSGVEFNPNVDSTFTKAKINNNGRKQVGILNGKTMKSLYMSTPLMLTWGVNEYNDEGKCSYDMALQFPRDEYDNEDCVKFLKNMQAFETKIKEAAIENSRDWLNKSKLTPDAVDALWSPMLKYPKDKETGDADYSRPPTLKIKIPYWEGEFKNVEIYNENRESLYPNINDEEPKSIQELIVKGSNTATIIQCGGIWVANGKFGVTWKLFQAVVKPRASLVGKCHIELTKKDIEQLNVKPEDNSDNESNTTYKPSTMVEDSDDENTEIKQETLEEVKEEVSKKVEVEDLPKKKKMVKKKSAPVSNEADA